MNTMTSSALKGAFLFLVSFCSAQVVIDPDVSVLSTDINKLMENVLGVAEIQSRVNQLEFDVVVIDGSSFVDQLASNISDSIQIHVDAVRRLKYAAIPRDNTTYEERTPCCRYDPARLSSNNNYRDKIDENGICEIIGSNVAQYTPLSEQVYDAMKENFEKIPDLKWQYVGTEEGVLTLFPAARISDCRLIENPRLRPWYIETTRPIAKNILILLDSSASMRSTFSSQTLLDIARQAISIVLDTLTPNDKVGIVAFNSSSLRPGGCFTSTLASATDTNIRFLRDFMATLTPAGESYFGVGIRNAFDLLNSTVTRTNQSYEEEFTILFISDGQPKEMYRNESSIYQDIISGNEGLNNRAVIYTYGLGRQVNVPLMTEMAKQNFSKNLYGSNSPQVRPREGKYFMIDDLSNLSDTMTEFYRSYNETTDTNQPTFSVPYVDGGGLGVIFTVGLPVFYPGNGVLYGVVSIDIAVRELFQHATYFGNTGDSYVFVIDRQGRVITHPLMPVPDNHTDAPNFLQINQLERHDGIDDVIESMVRGESGQRSLSVTKILPVLSAVETYKANATYYWRPISGGLFSVCFVLQIGGYNVDVDAQSVVRNYNGVANMFRYHRLDLDVGSDLCRRYYQKSIVSRSIGMFAARSFRSPSRYESSNENTSTLVAFNDFFDKLLLPGANVSGIEAQNQEVFEMFARGVVADVLWTSWVDDFWLNRPQNFVLARFIGTTRGVDRLFPGTRLPMEFDVTTRPWFELAVASPTLSTFSTPYNDTAGRGTVITISQAITTPDLSTDYEVNGSKVLGVMGMDFSLDYLFSRLQSLVPQCRKTIGNEVGWFCSLIDDYGNIILEESYTNEVFIIQHIAEIPNLMRVLFRKGFIKRMQCIDLERKMFRRWYKLSPDTRLDQSDALSEDSCSRYFIRRIENTNIFFAAHPYQPHCHNSGCTSPICKDEFSSDVTSQQTFDCECISPISSNSCENFLNVSSDIPLCYPDREIPPAVNECIPEHLPQCDDVICSEPSNESTCSALVLCTWCKKRSNGSNIQTPFCSLTEDCYRGVLGKRIPRFDMDVVCPVLLDEWSALHTALACIGGILVVVVLTMVVIYCRRAREIRKNKKKEEEHTDCDPASPCGNKCSSPSAAQVHEKPKKKQPQVVISVIDSSGAEILRKPVQLVQGGVTYGAAPDQRKHSHDNKLRRKSSASDAKHGKDTPLPPKSYSPSASSGDSGNPCTSSEVSDTEFRFPKVGGRMRSPEVHRRINHQLEDMNYRDRFPTRSQELLVTPGASRNVQYLHMRSASHDNLALDLPKSPTRGAMFKSADNLHIPQPKSPTNHGNPSYEKQFSPTSPKLTKTQSGYLQPMTTQPIEHEFQIYL